MNFFRAKNIKLTCILYNHFYEETLGLNTIYCKKCGRREMLILNSKYNNLPLFIWVKDKRKYGK